jgi:hypothetical protein
MKNERIRDVFLQKKNYLKDLKSKCKAKTLKKNSRREEMSRTHHSKLNQSALSSITIEGVSDFSLL